MSPFTALVAHHQLTALYTAAKGEPQNGNKTRECHGSKFLSHSDDSGYIFRKSCIASILFLRKCVFIWTEFADFFRAIPLFAFSVSRRITIVKCSRALCTIREKYLYRLPIQLPRSLPVKYTLSLYICVSIIHTRLWYRPAYDCIWSRVYRNFSARAAATDRIGRLYVRL